MYAAIARAQKNGGGYNVDWWEGVAAPTPEI